MRDSFLVFIKYYKFFSLSGSLMLFNRNIIQVNYKPTYLKLYEMFLYTLPNVYSISISIYNFMFDTIDDIIT